MHCSTENLQQTLWNMNRTRNSVVFLSGKFDQIHLILESFTKELISNASTQLFPDNILSFFRDFLTEQLNLEGQWEVAISVKSCPSMYQNVTEGKVMFFDEKLFRSRLNLTDWNPIFTFPLRILLKRWTPSFKKDTITAKAVSQIAKLEEHKKTLPWNWQI